MLPATQTPYERIKQYILDDVKRPDLQDIINRRIQRSLTRWHRKDMWKKDLIEQRYIFAQPETVANLYSSEGSNSLFMTTLQPVNRLYIQQIDKNLLTRWRSFLYIRKWVDENRYGQAQYDPASGAIGTAAGGDLTEKSPDSMFDAYGGDVSDIYYESGDFIQIKSSTPLSSVFIGYFADPLIEPVEKIYSWIARDYPNLIAADVKMRMFGDIGRDEEKKSAADELRIEVDILNTNNIKISQR